MALVTMRSYRNSGGIPGNFHGKDMRDGYEGRGAAQESVWKSWEKQSIEQRAELGMPLTAEEEAILKNKPRWVKAPDIPGDMSPVGATLEPQPKKRRRNRKKLITSRAAMRKAIETRHDEQVFTD